jgi:hypothetical protein
MRITNIILSLKKSMGKNTMKTLGESCAPISCDLMTELGKDHHIDINSITNNIPYLVTNEKNSF